MRPLYTLGLLMLSIFSNAQTPTITSNHVVAGNCRVLTYGNGRYVASAGRTLTSTDARTWTVLNDSVPPFAFLAFGNGVFVGITDPGLGAAGIYSSSDGINWTRRGTVPNEFVSAFTFAGGMFYVVSNDLGYPSWTIITSSDGINWSGLYPGNFTIERYLLSGLAYNGSIYVIGVTMLSSRYDPYGSSGVLYSSTGAPDSWNFAYVSRAVPAMHVQWVKDRFYLFVGDGIETSTDGITWGPFSAVDSMLDGTVSTLTNGLFFAAGDSIYLIGGSTLAVSTDGIHFKSLPPPNLQSVGGLSVNGRTFIYGDGGLATATDGIHFALNGTFFSSLATNGSNFVAAGRAGSAGPVFTSPDFGTWTENPPVTASQVLYNGSKYVATGSGNTYFSADGTTWSNAQAAPAANAFNAMDYGAGRYVAGTSYSLLSSTDAINWSEVDTSYSFYYKIRYLNNNFFALGMNHRAATGLIMQSSDGIHWQNITPQLDTVVTYYNDVMYDGTKYYFTGRKHWTDLFTISTTDPTNTNAYGAMGGIVHPAEGTSAVDYFPTFDDFIYRNGWFVGTMLNGVDGHTYLVYSTDGMNWTTSPLGGSGHARTTVSAADIYHIVGEDGGYYTASFAGATPPLLLHFQATAMPSRDGEDSRLRWEIKNDPDIAYFLVQHSLDSMRWDSIGKVDAEKRGKKQERNEKKRGVERYQFIHENPPVGANYYRIGITDGEERRWWSPVRNVDIRGKDLCIYPNPARDVLHVRLPEAGRARLIVYNHAWLPVRGRVTSGDKVSIDLRSLPPGIYYLQVFQGGKRYSKEFIIAE